MIAKISKYVQNVVWMSVKNMLNVFVVIGE